MVPQVADTAGTGLYTGQYPLDRGIHDGTTLGRGRESITRRPPHRQFYVALKVTTASTGPPRQYITRPHSSSIWTTTPWTFPANLAIAVAKDYEGITSDLSARTVIHRQALLHAFLADVARASSTSRTSPRSPEAPSRAPWPRSPTPSGSSPPHRRGPRGRDLQAPVHRPGERGPCRGLCHRGGGHGPGQTAPGHGQEDYPLGLAVASTSYNPVDDHGRYVQDLPEEFVFLRACASGRQPEDRRPAGGQGCPAVAEGPLGYPQLPPLLALLQPRHLPGHLPVVHPHGSRTTSGPRLRRDRPVNSVPAWGKTGSGAWSRTARTGASPGSAPGRAHPALYCEDCGAPLADAGLMNKVADAFEEAGADVCSSAWSRSRRRGHLPRVRQPRHAQGQATSRRLVHSGVSYAAVCEKDPELAPPWTSTSRARTSTAAFPLPLLCAVGTRGKAPYETAVTHGFILDEKDRKLSKRPRTCAPRELHRQRGASFWPVDRRRGLPERVAYSEQFVDRLADGYRKIRNALRYALGHLAGFDSATDGSRREVDRPRPLRLRAAPALPRPGARGLRGFHFTSSTTPPWSCARGPLIGLLRHPQGPPLLRRRGLARAPGGPDRALRRGPRRDPAARAGLRSLPRRPSSTCAKSTRAPGSPTRSSSKASPSPTPPSRPRT